MTSRMSSSSKGRLAKVGAGFVLLEVIMAMALFGIVGVALTRALDAIAQNALDSRKEVKLLRTLESYLTEASKAVEFEEGVEPLEEDENGVFYEREIAILELENYDGQILDRMWHIIIRATWEKGDNQYEEIAETYRYEPMYQNNR